MLPSLDAVDEEHHALVQVYRDMVSRFPPRLIHPRRSRVLAQIKLMVDRLNQLRNVKILYRATTAAHPGCSKKLRPYRDLADAVAHEHDLAQQWRALATPGLNIRTQMRWDWDMFDTLNDQWRGEIARLHQKRREMVRKGTPEAALPPKWLFVDFWEMSLQRPDAHSDCLHCESPSLFNCSFAH